MTRLGLETIHIAQAVAFTKADALGHALATYLAARTVTGRCPDVSRPKALDGAEGTYTAITRAAPRVSAIDDAVVRGDPESTNAGRLARVVHPTLIGIVQIHARRISISRAIGPAITPTVLAGKRLTHVTTSTYDLDRTFVGRVGATANETIWRVCSRYFRIAADTCVRR